MLVHERAQSFLKRLDLRRVFKIHGCLDHGPSGLRERRDRRKAARVPTEHAACSVAKGRPPRYHSSNALIEFSGIKIVHISRIDLNLLAIFDTIYAEGSITRASRRLNLSQPAISHALGRLRQMIDDPLFTRHGRLMMPTPLARRMIEPIRQSLQTIEATLTKRDPFAPATAVKHFTVGTRDVLEAAILGALMRNVAAAVPRITISSVRAERRELERELSAGTLDAAIDVLLPLPEEVRRERLGTEWLTVVARRRHPNVGRRLTLKTYLGRSIIGLVAPPRTECGGFRACRATICAAASGCGARAIWRHAGW